MRAAKVPEDVTFATKPQLAQQMIERAIAGRVPFAWVTGDEAHGDSRLGIWLDQEGVHYVLAVASNWHVWIREARQLTVAKIVEMMDLTWQMMSAGDGAKGPRVCDWARVPLLSRQSPNERWLLLRRGRTDDMVGTAT